MLLMRNPRTRPAPPAGGMIRMLTVARAALLIVLSLAGAAVAQRADMDWVPSHDGWVSDHATILTTADKQRLSDQLSRFHDETHHQIEILTVRTLYGEVIEVLSQ